MRLRDSIERWLDWPEWAKDAAVTHVDIHFDWKDRLLILIGRPVLVTTKVLTENVVGKNEGRAQVSVSRIRWPWARPRFAVAEAPPGSFEAR